MLKKWLLILMAALLAAGCACAEELTSDDMASAIGETAPAAEERIVLQARGSDPLESYLVNAFNSWSASALVSDGTEDALLFMQEQAPEFSLLGSFAMSVSSAAVAQAPGQQEGIQSAANRLFSEMTASVQDFSNPASGHPFRGTFIPEYFMLNSFQSAPSAELGTAMDCAMLFLTDALGNRVEGPAYTVVRFFPSNGQTVVWLSDDMYVMQACAQAQSIRQLGGTLTAEDGSASWSALRKDIASAAYTPAPENYVPAPPASEVLADIPIAGAAEAMAAPTPAPQVERVTIKSTTGSAISIRSQPDKSSSRITQAFAGESYEYLGCTDNSWLMIRTNDGIFGYVSPRLVEALPGEKGGPTVTAASQVKIHQLPATYSDSTGMTVAGRKYFVINDKNSEWVQIRLTDGSIGWVNRKNIR